MRKRRWARLLDDAGKSALLAPREVAGRRNAIQKTPRRCEDGDVVVGQREGETSVSIGSAITEIVSDKCSGIMSANNDDNPFAAQEVVGSQRCAAHAQNRFRGHTCTQRGDKWATRGKAVVATRRPRGEVSGVLKGSQHDWRRFKGEPLVLQVL
jgi:hypothetical protein